MITMAMEPVTLKLYFLCLHDSNIIISSKSWHFTPPLCKLLRLSLPELEHNISVMLNHTVYIHSCTNYI